LEASRRLLNGPLQRAFLDDVPRARAELAERVRQGVRQNRAQPRCSLGLAPAPELTDSLVRLQQRLLNHIRRVELAPKLLRKLKPRQQVQVVPVALQRPFSAWGWVGHQVNLIEETQAAAKSGAPNNVFRVNPSEPRPPSGRAIIAAAGATTTKNRRPVP